jgi:hypothetical protein
MSTVTEIRNALKTRLATISGLRPYAQMPASPQLPGAAVALKSFAYSRDFDDGVLYTFSVWVYVSAGSDVERAQAALDAYLAPSGATSIKAAIEADADLAGTCDWVRVTGATEGPRLVDIAGAQPLAIPIDVEVMSS